MDKNGVTGVIVSLPSPITDRIFHHHEVYAMLSESGSTELAEGDRIFFFDTGGKGLEGEARIEEISFEKASQVRRYGQELCLSGEELDRYLGEAGVGEDATMLVMKVEDATKYSRPLKCSLTVGKNGLYVNAEVSDRIMRENQAI